MASGKEGSGSGEAPPAWLRLTASLLAGVIAGFLTPRPWPPEARVLTGWVVFCTAFLIPLWRLILTATPERTRTLASREDDARAVASTVTTAAALTSLAGVVVTLHEAGTKEGLPMILLTLLAVVTVAASWLLAHTEYVLHYARRYYTDGGGVNFPDGPKGDSLPDPDYRDFAYLALTLGMTFQVSDTTLSTRAMRRLATTHALLSYVFGTVIVAVTINGVAGLIGGK